MRNQSQAKYPPVAIADIEDALVLLAYFIERDGDVHLPMYEKLEAELEARNAKKAIKDRARRRLDAYLSERGGLALGDAQNAERNHRKIDGDSEVWEAP